MIYALVLHVQGGMHCQPNLIADLISHCRTSSRSWKMEMVKVTCGSSSITRFQGPPQTVSGRAVVQTRRVGSTPTAARVSPARVGVTEGGPGAAGSWAAVRHDVLADCGCTVKVLGLVAIDDHHARVVWARAAAGMPDSCALKVTKQQCIYNLNCMLHSQPVNTVLV